MRRQVVDLSPAQVAALAVLAAEAAPTSRLRLEQTHTKTGGTHLYVTARRRVHHVAASTGRCVDVGALVSP